MSRAKILWVVVAIFLLLFWGAYILKTEIVIAPSIGIFPEPHSGITGIVMIGPTCPVVRYPSDGTCANKPYPADFKITRRGSLFSRAVSSGKDGTFSIDLPPGEYTITPVLKGIMPHASPQNATVSAGTTTQVYIIFDSGIR